MVLVYAENVKEMCLKNDEFMIFRHILRNFAIQHLFKNIYITIYTRRKNKNGNDNIMLYRKR
mgnify:FL=1